MEIRIRQEYSGYKTIEAGVPQGAVLSPLLFNNYATDVPEQRNSALLAHLADDTAIGNDFFNAGFALMNLQERRDVLLT